MNAYESDTDATVPLKSTPYRTIVLYLEPHDHKDLSFRPDHSINKMTAWMHSDPLCYPHGVEHPIEKKVGSTFRAEVSCL
jgi:hypothetical protein